MKSVFHDAETKQLLLGCTMARRVDSKYPTQQSSLFQLALSLPPRTDLSASRRPRATVDEDAQSL